MFTSVYIFKVEILSSKPFPYTNKMSCTVCTNDGNSMLGKNLIILIVTISLI